jgi:hypothetical protein
VNSSVVSQTEKPRLLLWRTPKAGTGGLSTVHGLPFFLQAELLKPYIRRVNAVDDTDLLSTQKLIGWIVKLE